MQYAHDIRDQRRYAGLHYVIAHVYGSYLRFLCDGVREWQTNFLDL